jgi:hypothetical protein
LIKRIGEAEARICSVGDYVLATKWSDGDPHDQWAVGFLKEIDIRASGDVRYHIIDNSGNLFRGNGFRRIAKITPKFGNWLVKHSKDIDNGNRSLWSLKKFQKRDLSLD